MQDDNYIATTNNCKVSDSTLPAIYQLKDLRHVKKYKHTLSFQREEVTDLKSIIDCLNTNTTRELWIPSKPSRTTTDVHGAATDAVDTTDNVSSVASGDLNKYASLLLRSGMSRRATRLMLSSCLNGACGVDIDDSWTVAEETCGNSIGDELGEDIDLGRIRHFRPRMYGNRLVWAAERETGQQRSEVPTTGSEDVLRAPFTVFADILRGNAHLLNNHCTDQKVSLKGAKRRRCEADDGGGDGGVCSDSEASQRNEAVGSAAVHSRSCEGLASSGLARHCEGLADSALEMVLEFCQQAAEGGVDQGPLAIGWEQVLRCVQSRSEEAARSGASRLKMGDRARELLDLRLAPAVADRVTGRLLGLYGGARVPGASRAVPSVLNRGLP